MSEIIGFYNRKGGVGKTTLALHTILHANNLGIEGLNKFDIRNILVLDKDEQGSLCQWLSGYKWEGQEEFKLSRYIDVRFLGDIYEEDFQKYDLIVIDFPPQVTILDEMEDLYKKIVDTFIVPVQGRLSLNSAEELKNIFNDLSETNKVILVPNGTDVRYAVGRKEMELIKAIAGNENIDQIEVFDFSIPHHQVVRKAEMLGQATWEVPYGIRAKATKNLQVLAEWILLGKRRAKLRKTKSEK